MRIVSLIPSATEMSFALGLQDDLIAVTHECDYPAAALEIPRVTRSAQIVKPLGVRPCPPATAIAPITLTTATTAQPASATPSGRAARRTRRRASR